MDNDENGLVVSSSSGNNVRGNTTTGNGLFGIALSAFAHDNVLNEQRLDGQR